MWHFWFVRSNNVSAAPCTLITSHYNLQSKGNVCSSIYFWQKQFTDMSVTNNDQLPTPLSHWMNQNIAFDNLRIYQNRVMIVSKLAQFMHCSIHPPDSSWKKKIDCRSDCWAMGPLLIEIGFQISCLVSPGVWIQGILWTLDSSHRNKYSIKTKSQSISSTPPLLLIPQWPASSL